MRFDLDFILIVSPLSNAREIGTFTKYVSRPVDLILDIYVSLSSQTSTKCVVG